MTTVAQVIDFLKTLPPDAKVRVLKYDASRLHPTVELVDLKLPTTARLPADNNCYFWGDNRLDLGLK
jgi:hypothetical protein